MICGDKAGFIANALLFGYLNHAVAMYEAHASREDIDAAMRFGCGYPMGPLALLDLIGLDTAYEILDTMYKQGRDRLRARADPQADGDRRDAWAEDRPPRFYTYEAADSPVVVADALTPSPDSAPGCADIRRVGVVGTGTMAGGIVEVFAKAGYDHLRRPQPGEGGRRARHDRQVAREGDPARPARGDRAGRRPPGSPAAPASTTSPRWTSWSRRSPRTSP